MDNHFRQNLILLCSYFPSVSDVCRRIGINRAQFNKYLSGTVRPSRSNLRKIYDFFGVEEYELLLPKDQFVKLIQLRPTGAFAGNRADGGLAQAIEHLQSVSLQNELQSYLGYYYEYYYSMSAPGKILKSLIHVMQRDSSVVYHRMERLEPVGKVGHRARCRYFGHALFLKDRLFLTDYESLTSSEISHTILFASYKLVLDRLDGLKLGISAAGKRMPAASRVTWEYLGRNVDPRRAYRKTGFLDPGDPSLDRDIQARIQNTLDDSHLFLAQPGDS